MASTLMKIEVEAETCAVCGCDGGGELLSLEEHEAGAPAPQVPLRAVLLHLNNYKVVPEGKLCASCVRRATEAYDFSTALATRSVPPLSEKIRVLRRRLHELTQKIDVFIVVGGPGVNNGGSYSEDDIIMVERDALAAAAAADDEDLEKARNACGETVYQCSICPMSFEHVSEYRAHTGVHPAGVKHSCWTCGAQFLSRAALHDHAALHAAHRDLTCHLCNLKFTSGAEYRAHGAAARCARACPACAAAVGGGRDALAAHARALHAPPARPPLLCALCFAVLPSAQLLAAHALTHRQADRFVCGYDACILRFSSRSELLNHIRKSHAGSVPPLAPTPAPAPHPAPPAHAHVPCDHCSRTFGSVAAMKRHARVHRREQPQTEQAEEAEEMDEGVGRAEEAEWRVEALAALGEGGVEYLEVETLDDL